MDKRKVAEIKQTANRLSEILIKDLDEFVVECHKIYSGGKFTKDEYGVIVNLSDVYCNVKVDNMTREEAIEKQRELFAGLRVSSI